MEALSWGNLQRLWQINLIFHFFNDLCDKQSCRIRTLIFSISCTVSDEKITILWCWKASSNDRTSEVFVHPSKSSTFVGCRIIDESVIRKWNIASKLIIGLTSIVYSPTCFFVPFTQSNYWIVSEIILADLYNTRIIELNCTSRSRHVIICKGVINDLTLTSEIIYVNSCPKSSAKIFKLRVNDRNLSSTILAI